MDQKSRKSVLRDIRGAPTLPSLVAHTSLHWVFELRDALPPVLFPLILEYLEWWIPEESGSLFMSKLEPRRSWQF